MNLPMRRVWLCVRMQYSVNEKYSPNTCTRAREGSNRINKA